MDSVAGPIGQSAIAVTTTTGGTLPAYGRSLALLASLGHRICIVTATGGDCGSEHHSLEETSRIRRGEAAKTGPQWKTDR